MDLRFSISDRYWVVKLAEICPAGLLDGSWPRGTTLIWELSLVFSFLQFTARLDNKSRLWGFSESVALLQNSP